MKLFYLLCRARILSESHNETVDCLFFCRFSPFQVFKEICHFHTVPDINVGL
jgi:hypothetical protein